MLNGFSLDTLNTTLLLLLLAPLLLFGFAASGLITLIIRQHISPLRRLRGPSSPSFWLGNLKAMHDMENTNLLASWEADYGSSFVYHGFIGGCRLMITDLRAVAHVLSNAYDYPKPDFVRDSLATMAGGHDGLLTSEGDQHKRQRRILTPAFSHANLKAITPIFWEKASELRDIWLCIANERDPSPITQVKLDDKPGNAPATPAKVDALAWLGRATLDIIGLAGFGYTFNALTDESNELALAYGAMFSTARKFRVMTILQVWFPILRGFSRNRATMRRTRDTIRRIGLELIEERKAAALAECVPMSPSPQKYDSNETYAYTCKSALKRDLLSVLVRSNLSTSPTSQMSTEETLCQISTFMAAGHETTSSALTWCLYALAKAPNIQSTLRAHLLSLPPTHSLDDDDEQQLSDDLFRLPYLDWVVREVLRLHSPVTTTMRVCARDRDEIPVERGYVDKSGVVRRSVEVRRHDIISVPVQAINRSVGVWGEDAGEFRPERWENPPAAVNTIPGLWSNMLTFLGGSRSCIGYKFAIMEIKIFLYVLLRDIEFSIDPALVIEKKVNVVTRPFVKSEPSLGNQMPLYIRPVVHHNEFSAA